MMARLSKTAPASSDDLLDAFLTGRFLKTMRLYADMAGTSNPAVDAADALQRGDAATVPGEWIGPPHFGLTYRLQKGRPAEVVGHD